MCESGSMVEHCLPKATVASSNLVFRSKKITFFIKNTRKSTFTSICFLFYHHFAFKKTCKYAFKIFTTAMRKTTNNICWCGYLI